MSCFIIAEAGVNHNGDEDLAFQLIEVAAKCGADAVKFQTFDTDKLVRPGAKKAAYQRNRTGSGDQYDMLKGLELTQEMHQNLYRRCQDVGIEFMSTPFDRESAIFLKDMGMQRIKIASGEMTNLPFIQFLASMNMPLILSTGMSDMDEVKEAVACINESRIAQDNCLESYLTVLHCTSNYPAASKDVNLKAMVSMADALNVPIGYSDHTQGLAVATAAVALGASVIEKHFTLDRALDGPDHNASLTPDELKIMVQQIREVEEALGDPEKRPADSELPVRALVRRSVTAVRDITEGDQISSEDVALLRPGTGIQPAELNEVIGRKAATALPAGTTINWGDIQ